MIPGLAGRHIRTGPMKAGHQLVCSHEKKEVKDVFVVLYHFLLNVAWDSLT